MTLNLTSITSDAGDRLENQRIRIYELERENADLRRQVSELRAAVEALLAPPIDVNIR